MGGVASFAFAQFGDLLVGEGQVGVFLRDAVPKVFDELKTFGAAKLEERRKFAVHAGNSAFSDKGQQARFPAGWSRNKRLRRLSPLVTCRPFRLACLGQKRGNGLKNPSPVWARGPQ
jgi:hypothetical protein